MTKEIIEGMIYMIIKLIVTEISSQKVIITKEIIIMKIPIILINQQKKNMM